MGNFLEPYRSGSRSTTVVSNRSERHARRIEAEVMAAGLEVWADAEIERMEALALGEAVSTVTDIEMRYYDRYLAAAGNSAVKHDLLARKLDILAGINERRLVRRFGAR